MSRVPRFQEHLKSGFTAEAVSAARCRANAARAESEDKPNLARSWLELAEAKDRLAIAQLEAAGQIRDAQTAVSDALAEDHYENDVLYPKMIREVEGSAATVFREVVEAQQAHLERLEELRTRLQGSPGDLEE